MEGKGRGREEYSWQKFESLELKLQGVSYKLAEEYTGTQWCVCGGGVCVVVVCVMSRRDEQSQEHEGPSKPRYFILRQCTATEVF